METNAFSTFLIDDDADDREVFAIAVKELQVPVRHGSVSSGEEAIEFFRNHPDKIPDVIFLDLNMPKMNGMECYLEIRKIGHTMHVPVCIYSTNLQMIDGMFRKENDQLLFMEKPLDMRTLVSSISELIETILENKQITNKHDKK